MTRRLALLLVCACGSAEPGEVEPGSESSGGGPPPAPGAVFEGKVDALALCGFEGAKNVTLRATRVGCVPGPPAPCTLKTDPYEEFIGDAVVCPASETARDMRVTVANAGRYQVDARTVTASGTQSLCYAPMKAVELEIGNDEVEASARVFVAAQSGPCPPP